MGLHCFVTVGSTQFEPLVAKVLEEEVLEVLCSLGFDEICVQMGSGRLPEGLAGQEAEEGWKAEKGGMKIRLVRYKKNLADEMQRADLVIGHAGAGTILESLELGKPLVVVVNDALMDNHQLELADRLAKDGYLLYTHVRGLVEMLHKPELFRLEKWPQVDATLFSKFLDKCMEGGLKLWEFDRE